MLSNGLKVESQYSTSNNNEKTVSSNALKIESEYFEQEWKDGVLERTERNCFLFQKCPAPVAGLPRVALMLEKNGIDIKKDACMHWRWRR